MHRSGHTTPPTHHLLHLFQKSSSASLLAVPFKARCHRQCLCFMLVTLLLSPCAKGALNQSLPRQILRSVEVLLHSPYENHAWYNCLNITRLYAPKTSKHLATGRSVVKEISPPLEVVVLAVELVASSFQIISARGRSFSTHNPTHRMRCFAGLACA